MRCTYGTWHRQVKAASGGSGRGCQAGLNGTCAVAGAGGHLYRYPHCALADGRMACVCLGWCVLGKSGPRPGEGPPAHCPGKGKT